MKRLHNQVNASIVVLNSTATATGENYASLKKLEKDLSEVKNALKEANEVKGARYNKEESFGIDSQVFGEFQTLTNQKITNLWNELGNTTDTIMDQMFENYDKVGNKMKEYDNKILNTRNEYNTIEGKISTLNQALNEAMTKTEDQVSFFKL